MGGITIKLCAVCVKEREKEVRSIKGTKEEKSGHGDLEEASL